MTILDVCDNGDVLSAMRILNILISIIRIVVPIILIVSLMISYAGAVKNSDSDALNKANKALVPKVVAAILVFMIPIFVNMLADAVDTDKDGYLSCLANATTDKIDAAYRHVAEKSLDLARQSLKKADYQVAKSNINRISNESDKAELLKELEDIKEYIDLREQIYKLAKRYNKDDYKKLRKEIESISDPEVKERLLKELEDNVKQVASIGGFVLDPNDELYRGLKRLGPDGTTLESVLNKNGSNSSILASQIRDAVESAGVGTREAPVVAALTLMETLANYGYYVSYFWGGKWNKVGVNPNWGAYQSPIYCEGQWAHPNPAYCKATYIYSGFDCSGFVNWAIAQGFQDDNAGKQKTGAGGGALATGGVANCDTGDTLVSSNHIVLVVEPQDSEGRYLIAESTGGALGTRLSYIYYGDSVYSCSKVRYSN